MLVFKTVEVYLIFECDRCCGSLIDVDVWCCKESPFARKAGCIALDASQSHEVPDLPFHFGPLKLTISRNLILRLHTIDLDSEHGLASFSSRTGVARQELETLGEAALSRGCRITYAEKEHDYGTTESYKLWIFRCLHREAPSLDRLLLHEPANLTTRLQLSPRTGRYTCAVDVVVFISLIEELGTQKCDLLPPARLAALPAPAQLLRSLVSSDLATLSRLNIEKARNILAESLVVHAPHEFRLGEFWDMEEVMNVCFSGQPRLSWTRGHGISCCDKIVGLSAHHAISQDQARRNHVPAGVLSEDQSLQASIQQFFHRGEDHGSHVDCSTGEGCERTLRLYDELVFDRLPPLLRIDIGIPITQKIGEKIELLESFVVEAIGLKPPSKKQWMCVPRGAIFMRGHNHFFVRWLRPDGLITSYDSMRVKPTTTHAGWWEEIASKQAASVEMLKDQMRKETGVISVFFNTQER